MHLTCNNETEYIITKKTTSHDITRLGSAIQKLSLIISELIIVLRYGKWQNSIRNRNWDQTQALLSFRSVTGLFIPRLIVPITRVTMTMWYYCLFHAFHSQTVISAVSGGRIHRYLKSNVVAPPLSCVGFNIARMDMKAFTLRGLRSPQMFEAFIGSHGRFETAYRSYLEDGADRLPRNIRKYLAINAAEHHRRAMASFTQRRGLK
jgi:hypothetical protein